jgi:hypothetical protein
VKKLKNRVRRDKMRRLLIGFLAVAGFVLLIGLVYASNFTDSTAADFNNGTYINTTHNGTAVILSGNNLSGNYTSRIFDAGGSAIWNNMTVSKVSPSSERLLAVDNNAGIYISDNGGVNWSVLNSDYNGGNTGGATYMAKNSTEDIFILHGQDIWVSSNDGISWTKINDNYNGEGDASDGIVFEIDFNNNLFVAEGDSNVWRSNNSGINWTLVNSSYNGAAVNPDGMASNRSGALFIVDHASDVWASSDSGANWIQVYNDFNAGAANGASEMFSNGSNSLFILDGQDVWASTNSGANWTKINDDFNGAGDSSNAFAGYVNPENKIFIADGSEDIYNSTDSGSSFTLLMSNINGGSTATIKGITSTNLSSSIKFQAKNCSLANCSDGTFSGPDGTSSSYYTNSTSNLNLTGRYFQYISYFSRDNSSVSPYLTNITLDYTITDSTAPSVVITYPQNTTYNINISNLNYTASDANLQACWYSLDSGLTNISIACGTNATGLISSEGSNTWLVAANDSSGNKNSTTVTFFKDTIKPLVQFVSPTETNNSFLNRNNISANVTANDTNLRNITIYLTNSSGLIQQNVSGVSPFFVNFINLADGVYFLNATANDTAGNLNRTETRTITIDRTNPLINFTAPTPANNSIRTVNNIPINITASDSNLQTIRVFLMNSSFAVINSSNSSTSPLFVNFTGLADGRYYFNASANDSAGNSNMTETRTVLIDTATPLVNITFPLNSTNFTTALIGVNYTVSDANLIGCFYTNSSGQFNYTITCGQNISATWDEGTNVVRVYANDSANNLNFSYVSFTVDVPEDSGNTGGGSGGGRRKVVNNKTNNVSERNVTPELIIPNSEDKNNKEINESNDDYENEEDNGIKTSIIFQSLSNFKGILTGFSTLSLEGDSWIWIVISIGVVILVIIVLIARKINWKRAVNNKW